jgi:hypothetical protein
LARTDVVHAFAALGNEAMRATLLICAEFETV